MNTLAIRRAWLIWRADLAAAFVLLSFMWLAFWAAAQCAKALS